MKGLFKKTLFSFVSLMMLSMAAYAASPMGSWKTIDDVTGKPKGIVRISGNANDLTGTVVKTFPGASMVCTACSGRLKNKPIVGMTVMYGLKQEASNANTWSGGTIIDPKSGKSYHCTLTVSDDGRSMEVRGYVGMSVFGRSQTWVKVSGK